MARWLGSGIGTLHFSVFDRLRRRLTETSILFGPRLERWLQAILAVFVHKPLRITGHCRSGLRAVIVPSPQYRRR